MSWDVMVMKYEGRILCDVEEMDEAEQLPLGTNEEVREAVSKYLPGVEWSSPYWGNYAGGELEFELIISEDEEPVEALTVSIHGRGDAIQTLLQFSKPNGWSLFDCSTSEFIDPENPSYEGWEGYQELRDSGLEEQEGNEDDDFEEDEFEDEE